MPVTEVWILRANLKNRCFAHLCVLIKLTHRNLSTTDAAFFCKSWRDREFALRNGTLIKVQLDEIKIGLILRLLWVYTFNISSMQPLLLRCDREVLRMATIKDVARLAGVSPSTASRAMHDSSLISEETKQRVRKAMAKLDYSPNFAAQNLANKSSNMIGVILPAREDSVGDNPFFIQIIQGLATICNAHDYMVSVATGQSEEELIKNIETMIKRGNIRRFVFVYSKARDKVLEYVKKQDGVRFVIIGTPYEDQETTLYVDNDNRKAGFDATEFLYDKGLENILYVYTDLDDNVQNDRFLGYRDAVKKHGGQLLSLSLGSEGEHERTKALKDYFKAYPETEAIIACDDILAFKTEYSCEAAGIDGKKLAMMGFNNSAYGKIMHPTLTSVEIFPRFLGSEAAALAIDSNLKIESNCVIVPHKVIERESTRI